MSNLAKIPPPKALALNSSQLKAMDEINIFLNDKEGRQVFILDGGAGTGKTTIISKLSKTLLTRVVVGTFTGKASEVLRSKGVKSHTLHSLFFEITERVIKREDEKEVIIKEEDYVEETMGKYLVRTKWGAIDKEEIARRYDLIIMDEYSMISDELIKPILESGIKVIAVGDRQQLPPVNGKSSLLLAEPDFTLTEKVRFNEGSAVDNYVTGIIEEDSWEELIMFDNYLESDVILCHTNKTRQNMNRIYRRDKKLKGILDKGDTIICMANNKSQDVWNGQSFEVIGFKEVNRGKDVKIHCKSVVTGNERVFVSPMINLEESTDKPASASYHVLFNYGKCITTHKAQGSEYESVTVIDDYASDKDKEEYKKWIYTACTRAKGRLNHCMLHQVRNIRKKSV